MSEKLKELMSGGWSYRVYKIVSGGGVGDGTETKTYILIDEEGNEIPAVLVDEETVFTATANDIRLGTVAATSDGVTTGEKFIPSYNTIEGKRIITPGSAFTIPNPSTTVDNYDYTELQAVFCVFNTTIANSVGADKVTIEDGVYNTNSTDLLSTIVKDHDTKSINFGIINDTDKPYIIRYITYKEIY